MGLMENITSTISNLTGGKNSGILSAVVDMFSNNEQGGLNGVLDSFQKKGMDDKVSSWVSKGENKPVSDQEVREGLGEERIEAISRKSGQDKNTVVTGLTAILPELIDKLTPDGNVPKGNILQQGLDMLKNQFK